MILLLLLIFIFLGIRSYDRKHEYREGQYRRKGHIEDEPLEILHDEPIIEKKANVKPSIRGFLVWLGMSCYEKGAVVIKAIVGKVRKIKLPKFHFTFTHKLIIAIILSGFLFTNPSPSDFKTFLQAKKQEYYEKDIGREYNLLLFSIYTNNYARKTALGAIYWDKIQYIGILKNFYQL